MEDTAPSPSHNRTDEEHRHGAARNRLLAHLAINQADDQHDVVHWLEPVTDTEYAVAPPTSVEDQLADDGRTLG